MIHTEATPRLRQLAFFNLLARLRDNWIVIAPLVVVGYLVLIPVAYLIMLSLHAGSLSAPGAWTAQNYVTAIHVHSFIAALRNTILLAGIGSLGTVGVALLFAFLIERTDIRWRNLVWAALLLPVAIPSLFKTMGLTIAFDPHTGWINMLLRGFLGLFGFHLAQGPVNIYSLGGLVFLDMLQGSLVVFFMLVGPMRMIDPALEDAAAVAGTNYRKTMRRITLPMLVPALLAGYIFAFILSMNNFEAALIAGLPAHIFLLSTLVYFVVQVQTPVNYVLGATFSVFFMVIILALVVYYQRVVRVGARYATVTGKGYRPRRMSIGRWQWAALAFVLLYIFLQLVLPMIVLVYASVFPTTAAASAGARSVLAPSPAVFSHFTLAIYQQVLTSTGFLHDILNTAILTFVTPTIAMVLALITSWIIMRRKSFLERAVLDSLVFFPQAIPDIIIAVAFIILYLNAPFRSIPIYGTLLIIMLGLITGFLPFTTRIMNGAVVQIQKELEEASYVSGVSRFMTMARITFPLLLPAFFAGWVLAAAIALKTFTVPLLLGNPGSEVLSVRMWEYWFNGFIPEAGAVGVVFVVLAAPLALFARRFIVRYGQLQG